MNARDHIENLMTEYTEALDDARFADLGELFADGSVQIEGGPHSGRHAAGHDAVADLYRDIVALDAHHRTGTRHFISNLHFTIDATAGVASTRSYFAVTQQTATLPLQLVACGAYHDEFRIVADRWRFARRRIVCDQVGDLTQHML